MNNETNEYIHRQSLNSEVYVKHSKHDANYDYELITANAG